MNPSAPIRDVAPGLLATVVPAFDPPAFLRLATAAGEVVDRARKAYLRAAAATCRTGVPGWQDGPGLLVEQAPADAATLAAEVHEVGRGLRALGHEAVAASYLELIDNRVAEARDAETPRGG